MGSIEVLMHYAVRVRLRCRQQNSYARKVAKWPYRVSSFGLWQSAHLQTPLKSETDHASRRETVPGHPGSGNAYASSSGRPSPSLLVLDGTLATVDRLHGDTLNVGVLVGVEDGHLSYASSVHRCMTVCVMAIFSYHW